MNELFDITKPYYKFLEYVKANNIQNRIMTFGNDNNTSYQSYFIDGSGEVTKLAEFDGIDVKMVEVLQENSIIKDQVLTIDELTNLVGSTQGELRQVVSDDNSELIFAVYESNIISIPKYAVVSLDNKGYWTLTSTQVKVKVVAVSSTGDLLSIYGSNGNLAPVNKDSLMTVDIPVGKMIAGVTGGHVIDSKSGLIAVAGVVSKVNNVTIIPIDIVLTDLVEESIDLVKLELHDVDGNLINCVTQYTELNTSETFVPKGNNVVVYIDVPMGMKLTTVRTALDGLIDYIDMNNGVILLNDSTTDENGTIQLTCELEEVEALVSETEEIITYALEVKDSDGVVYPAYTAYGLKSPSGVDTIVTVVLPEGKVLDTIDGNNIVINSNTVLINSEVVDDKIIATVTLKDDTMAADLLVLKEQVGDVDLVNLNERIGDTNFTELNTNVLDMKNTLDNTDIVELSNDVALIKNANLAMVDTVDLFQDDGIFQVVVYGAMLHRELEFTVLDSDNTEIVTTQRIKRITSNTAIFLLYPNDVVDSTRYPITIVTIDKEEVVNTSTFGIIKHAYANVGSTVIDFSKITKEKIGEVSAVITAAYDGDHVGKYFEDGDHINTSSMIYSPIEGYTDLLAYRRDSSYVGKYAYNGVAAFDNNDTVFQLPYDLDNEVSTYEHTFESGDTENIEYKATILGGLMVTVIKDSPMKKFTSTLTQLTSIKTAIKVSTNSIVCGDAYYTYNDGYNDASYAREIDIMIPLNRDAILTQSSYTEKYWYSIDYPYLNGRSDFVIIKVPFVDASSNPSNNIAKMAEIAEYVVARFVELIEESNTITTLDISDFANKFDREDNVESLKVLKGDLLNILSTKLSSSTLRLYDRVTGMTPTFDEAASSNRWLTFTNYPYTYDHFDAASFDSPIEAVEQTDLSGLDEGKVVPTSYFYASQVDNFAIIYNPTLHSSLRVYDYDTSDTASLSSVELFTRSNYRVLLTTSVSSNEADTQYSLCIEFDKTIDFSAALAMYTDTSKVIDFNTAPLKENMLRPAGTIYEETANFPLPIVQMVFYTNETLSTETLINMAEMTIVQIDGLQSFSEEVNKVPFRMIDGQTIIDTLSTTNIALNSKGKDLTVTTNSVTLDSVNILSVLHKHGDTLDGYREFTTIPSTRGYYEVDYTSSSGIQTPFQYNSNIISAAAATSVYAYPGSELGWQGVVNASTYSDGFIRSTNHGDNMHFITHLSDSVNGTIVNILSVKGSGHDIVVPTNTDIASYNEMYTFNRSVGDITEKFKVIMTTIQLTVGSTLIDDEVDTVTGIIDELIDVPVGENIIREPMAIERFNLDNFLTISEDMYNLIGDKKATGLSDSPSHGETSGYIRTDSIAPTDLVYNYYGFYNAASSDSTGDVEYGISLGYDAPSTYTYTDDGGTPHEISNLTALGKGVNLRVTKGFRGTKFRVYTGTATVDRTDMDWRVKPIINYETIKAYIVHSKMLGSSHLYSLCIPFNSDVLVTPPAISGTSALDFFTFAYGDMEPATGMDVIFAEFVSINEELTVEEEDAIIDVIAKYVLEGIVPE